MEKLLLIDFDGTLCFDRFWRSFDTQLATAIQEVVFKHDGARADDWMRGKHTAEHINEFVATTLGIPYDSLWEAFVNECKQMKVAVETLQAIQTLRPKHRVVLLTDNMDCFMRFTVPALDLEKYFDAIVSSAG